MKLLHKNSLSGVGQLVLTAGLTFFSIPVFIRVLGDEAYGAFSIVTLAGNLNIFANLGLNTALLKFLSVQGKSRESDYDIAVTLCLLILIMVPLSILAISCQQYILQGLLGLSDILYSQVASLYRCVVLANLIILLGQTFTTVLDSQQRMYLTNFYQLIYSILYWGGIIVVVSFGNGLPEVGLVILSASVIWFGLVVVAAWRTWGWLQLGGLQTVMIQIARKQVSFSSKVYAAGLLSMLFEPMTKVLVARLIGVREVGYLEIAYKVRSQLWSLVTKVTYPLYPKIAQENDLGRLSRLIGNYQTGMLLVMVPFLLFFVIALPDLLGFWLPSANRIVFVATVFIATTFTLNSLGIPPYYFLMSRHHVGKTVWAQLTNVVVNLLVSLLTYQLLGIYGFILSNSLAILSSLVLCLYYQKKYIGWIEIDIQQVRRLVTITTLVGGPAFLISSLLIEPWERIGLIMLSTLLVYFLLFRHSYKQLKSWGI
ncbi:lipopolysaccharide biosynthesis protein [Spirosoma endbachense]|uniref:Oligosaccharide flippase family protein n=1 Tax=Spirosoma endbachense TaxID=2666025 RepID=A0A6P1VLB6_9BACT|nr:oligosaccharide flippase family protein [Spirosoma endbachense]QHV94071.1 oligosaccharide flippase family protein [Spirosoma endbachense]